MPVILENGTEQIRTWLDPQRFEWSKELQSLLKPYKGDLECYPVSKDVGKVGNNSPTFMVPVASSENKNNIANFFSNARTSAPTKKEEPALKVVKTENQKIEQKHSKEPEESRVTVDEPGTEDNAPIPIPALDATAVGVKREREVHEDEEEISGPPTKMPKGSSDTAGQTPSPQHGIDKTRSARKTRSASSNGTATRSPAKRSQRAITSFFNNEGA